MKQHMVEMLGGPGTLRFFLQPAMAIVLGVLHGMRDHHERRPPYLFGLIFARGDRLRRLGQGLHDILVPLAIAVLASGIFQYLILRRVYLVYVVSYAALFVALPYFVTRGLANRLTRERV